MPSLGGAAGSPPSPLREGFASIDAGAASHMHKRARGKGRKGAHRKRRIKSLPPSYMCACTRGRRKKSVLLLLLINAHACA